MLKAVAARCFQTGYAIFPGTAFAVAPSLASACEAGPALELSTAALSQLPPQGRVTHGSIRAGGPRSFARDASVLGNCKRTLPNRLRGEHREHTVATLLSQDHGVQHIVCAGSEPRVSDAGYYTRDHYASFYYINE